MHARDSVFARCYVYKTSFRYVHIYRELYLYSHIRTKWLNNNSKLALSPPGTRKFPPTVWPCRVSPSIPFHLAFHETRARKSINLCLVILFIRPTEESSTAMGSSSFIVTLVPAERDGKRTRNPKSITRPSAITGNADDLKMIRARVRVYLC